MTLNEACMSHIVIWEKHDNASASSNHIVVCPSRLVYLVLLTMRTDQIEEQYYARPSAMQIYSWKITNVDMHIANELSKLSMTFGHQS